MKWLKKIINRLFKTRLTTAQFTFLRNICKERKCTYCEFLVPYFGGWRCSNEDACKMDGIFFLSKYCCPYWKPDKKFIKRKLRKDGK